MSGIEVAVDSAGEWENFLSMLKIVLEFMKIKKVASRTSLVSSKNSQQHCVVSAGTTLHLPSFQASMQLSKQVKSTINPWHARSPATLQFLVHRISIQNKISSIFSVAQAKVFSIITTCARLDFLAICYYHQHGHNLMLRYLERSLVPTEANL